MTLKDFEKYWFRWRKRKKKREFRVLYVSACRRWLSFARSLCAMTFALQLNLAIGEYAYEICSSWMCLIFFLQQILCLFAFDELLMQCQCWQPSSCILLYSFRSVRVVFFSSSFIHRSSAGPERPDCIFILPFFWLNGNDNHHLTIDWTQLYALPLVMTNLMTPGKRAENLIVIGNVFICYRSLHIQCVPSHLFGWH